MVRKGSMFSALVLAVAAIAVDGAATNAEACGGCGRSCGYSSCGSSCYSSCYNSCSSPCYSSCNTCSTGCNSGCYTAYYAPAPSCCTNTCYTTCGTGYTTAPGYVVFPAGNPPATAVYANRRMTSGTVYTTTYRAPAPTTYVRTSNLLLPWLSR